VGGHMTGHFADKPFQAITCTGNDNTKTKVKKPNTVTLSTINRHNKTKKPPSL